MSRRTRESNDNQLGAVVDMGLEIACDNDYSDMHTFVLGAGRD